MDDGLAPRRAAPLPPDERRAAILAATVPLLRERGADVSTRELAEAAGVAEGTLFRVFADKRALLRAALAEATDPEPLERELARVDLTLPLEQRVRAVVQIVSARMDGVMRLAGALHDLALESPGRGNGHGRGHGPAHRTSTDPGERDARFLAAIARVLEPDRDELRVTPLQAAGLVRGVLLGDRMPGAPERARLTGAQVAACLVSGLRAGPRTTSHAPEP